MSIDRISLGEITIYGLRDGYFSLDGGAVFGVVPKIIWEKYFPIDEQNRIRLGLNSLLIHTPDALVLVDTGAGEMLKPQWRKYYSLKRDHGLTGALANLGFSPEDIDFVINTHLHFDHCGGNTRRNEDGALIPTFPRAEYLVQNKEWQAALNPGMRDKPSYISDYYFPLEEQGVLRKIEGRTRIIEGVEAVPLPGHTAGHQGVKIFSASQTLFFLGELVPTSAHVGLSYIMSYDLFPMTTLECKQLILTQAVKENWIVAFDHDPDFYFGRIKQKNEKFFFHNMEEE